MRRGWPRSPRLIGGTTSVGSWASCSGRRERGATATSSLEGDLGHVHAARAGDGSGTLTIRGDVGSRARGRDDGRVGSRSRGRSATGRGPRCAGGCLRIRGDAGRSPRGGLSGEPAGDARGGDPGRGDDRRRRGAGDAAGADRRRGDRRATGWAAAMIAGSIFAFGPVGPRGGAGMKRGTLAFFGGPTRRAGLLPTFAPSGRSRPPFLTLYLRQARGSGGSRCRTPLSRARSTATMGTWSSGPGRDPGRVVIAIGRPRSRS